MLPPYLGVTRSSFPSVCGIINLRNICTKPPFIKSTCITLKDYLPIWSLVTFWVCQNRPVCIFLLNTSFPIFTQVSYIGKTQDVCFCRLLRFVDIWDLRLCFCNLGGIIQSGNWKCCSKYKKKGHHDWFSTSSS